MVIIHLTNVPILYTKSTHYRLLTIDTIIDILILIGMEKTPQGIESIGVPAPIGAENL